MAPKNASGRSFKTRAMVISPIGAAAQCAREIRDSCPYATTPQVGHSHGIGRVWWDDAKSIYMAMNGGMGLRYTCNIPLTAFNLTSFTRMKVNLAANILSVPFGNMITAYDKQQHERFPNEHNPRKHEMLALYCTVWGCLFQTLNGKGEGKGIGGGSPEVALIRKCGEFFRLWEKEVDKNTSNTIDRNAQFMSRKCHYDIQLTCQAFTAFVDCYTTKDLLVQPGLNSQDRIEQFFACGRAASGGNHGSSSSHMQAAARQEQLAHGVPK